MTAAGANPRLDAAPAWRREPYRIFFPLGALIAWAGVLHWLLHAAGALANYEPIFHAMAQIQGFLFCFAAGFLFTAIPRRTGTAPPAGWQMAVGVAAPLGTTVAAWMQRWAVAQACWLALVAVLVGFALRRFRAAGAARRPPHSFVWIPLSLGMGVVGSLLTGVYGALGPAWFALHDLGRLLLLQGMFLGLVAGVGGLVLPLITRGAAPPDRGRTPRDRRILAGHLVAAALLAVSFWVEIYLSLRAGYALRAAVVLALLLAAGGIARRPTVPGWHRRAVWLSAWLLPVGYLLAAALPQAKKAGLHVVFIGGFAMMALAVAVHVVLAHGGFTELLGGRPWQVPAFVALLLAATVMRGLVDLDPRRFFLWLGGAAGAFLAATVPWGLLVLPRIWRPAPGTGERR